MQCDGLNQATGNTLRFVQDNHWRSARGVLSGLHFQRPPHAQGKLVRCISGAVFDVVVDMHRRSSPRCGRWVGAELSADNHRQLWLPPGFAHGFVVLTETADFIYKTTDYYAPHAEGSLRWDDITVGIEWPATGMPPLLAQKDAQAAAPLRRPIFFD